MVLDPENLYEVDSDVPDLTGAVLLHHFDGFMDAGAAGKLLVEHILSSYEHRVVARFDIDQLIDYRSRRPAMIFATDHFEPQPAPELLVHLVHDAAGFPFLLLSGPEPDFRWETFSAAVLELVDRWGVGTTIGFHGIPMRLPHTRPLGVTAHATRSELITGHQPFFSRVEVPGNVAAMLEVRLGEHGHDAIGFAAHVPHYLAQSTHPAAALVLLETITRTTGLALPPEVLRETARRAGAELQRQVNESEEVSEVVAALERQYDAFTGSERGEQSLLLEEEEIPSADELGAEFEKFLAEQPPK
ncbi:proteasome assembly chaperone family protein [Umezawaea tangerina]|uniref:Putative ATP-grasp superfamily ATP-dependent carboligase n=1 Tax=Umezawaea tangerina TaxID=84725 RepID=A0A2T0SMA2_9PSEU|nr:PAC2 family protein [Umezawaea tangerina]PRY34516.1 putative ATP-grasp superfamily ATP-dependent carboligase [Umezawaea tangerina]